MIHSAFVWVVERKRPSSLRLPKNSDSTRFSCTVPRHYPRTVSRCMSLADGSKRPVLVAYGHELTWWIGVDTCRPVDSRSFFFNQRSGHKMSRWSFCFPGWLWLDICWWFLIHKGIWILPRIYNGFILLVKVEMIDTIFQMIGAKMGKASAWEVEGIEV